MKFQVNLDQLSQATKGAVAQKTVVNRVTKPSVTFSSLKGKMSLTSGAMALLDINPEKDTVVVLDYGKEFEASAGFRFAIAKGYMKDGKLEGANLGKGGQFNYTGVWAAGMFPDVEFDAVHKSSQFLADKGLVEYDADSQRTKSFNIVNYDVVEMLDENDMPIDPIPVDEDSEGTPIVANIFPLVNRVSRPRVSGDTDVDFEETDTDQEPDLPFED